MRSVLANVNRVESAICFVSFSIQLQATDLTSKGYVGMDHALQLKQEEEHDQAATNTATSIADNFSFVQVMLFWKIQDQSTNISF